MHLKDAGRGGKVRYGPRPQKHNLSRAGQVFKFVENGDVFIDRDDL